MKINVVTGVWVIIYGDKQLMGYDSGDTKWIIKCVGDQ